MTAIHQFVPTFEPGAIASDALQVQKALRDAGHESEIFAEQSRGGLEAIGRTHTDYGSRIAANAGDTLIYHVAIGSVVAGFLKDRKERLVLRHHNITPVDYYAPWPDSNTYGMAWGRNQLRELVSRTSVATGVSEYNRRELEALHYSKTAVSPILFDFAAFDHDLDANMNDRLQQPRSDVGGTDWLFVGWIAPHKCQHDIIRAFAAYRRMYDPNARLHLVGRPALQSYWDVCEKMIAELGLVGSVHMTGRVSDGELGAYYRNADVLVCLSEHEGVGIPLLEAMHHRLPIVAYSAAAVPETLGDAGLLLPRKRPGVVAAAVHRTIADPSLAESLRKRGSLRLDAFNLNRAREALSKALVVALDGIGETDAPGGAGLLSLPGVGNRH